MARRLDGCTDAGLVSRRAGALFPPARFDPEQAFAHDGTAPRAPALLVPTMLRLMRGARSAGPFDAKLRAIYSGGEPVGKELYEWSAQVLKMTINELFGQTECNLVLGS